MRRVFGIIFNSICLIACIAAGLLIITFGIPADTLCSLFGGLVFAAMGITIFANEIESLAKKKNKSDNPTKN